MKKVHFNQLMLVVIASVMLLAACKTDKLSVSENMLEFEASGGKKSVDVETNVKSWEASTSSDWIKIGKSGVDFSVTVEKYTEAGKERTGEVTVTAGSASLVVVTVKQLPPPPNTLSVLPNEIIFKSGETGTKTATVTTNASSWDYNCSANWLTIAKQGITLRVTPTGLNTGEPRSVEITVTADNANPVTVTVKQDKTVDDKIPSGTYTATAIPYSTAPSSWSGVVKSFENNAYYGISNWTNFDSKLQMYLDVYNGKLILDDYTFVAEDDTYEYCFGAVYQSGGNWYDLTDFVVNYNASTRTLDFSGTYNGNQVYIALLSKHKSTHAWGIDPRTLVRSAKLVITPTTGSSLQNSSMQPAVNTSPTATKNSIVVDKSKSKKRPVNETRVLSILDLQNE